jgi:hypothetical protein
LRVEDCRLRFTHGSLFTSILVLVHGGVALSPLMEVYDDLLT